MFEIGTCWRTHMRQCPLGWQNTVLYRRPFLLVVVVVVLFLFLFSYIHAERERCGPERE